MEGSDLRRRLEMSDSILTGYYSGYYTNSGKRAKNPNELIRRLLPKKRQSTAEGLREIERIRKIEQEETKIGGRRD